MMTYHSKHHICHSEELVVECSQSLSFLDIPDMRPTSTHFVHRVRASATKIFVSTGHGDRYLVRKYTFIKLNIYGIISIV